VYLGTDGVLTGSARVAQETQERAAERLREQEIEQLEISLERKRKALEAQIAAMQANFDAEAKEQQRMIGQRRTQSQYRLQEQVHMAHSRKADIRQVNGNEPHEVDGETQS
jgi:circadian clock protein KaiC